MTEINLAQLAQQAKTGGKSLGLMPTAQRNQILLGMAEQLDSVGDDLWQANALDVAEAEEAGLAPSLIDRSRLTPNKVKGMAQGCRDVAALPDPLGQVFDGRTLPNGLFVAKKRVPLGVLAVIFESRPNVTIDISALSIKTGNGVIMRGGKESLRTNMILINMVKEACIAADAPAEAIQLITCTDHSLVPELLAMDDVIDLVIPRGGPGLQALVKRYAKMPVVYGGIGVCHLFVDASADVAKSVEIIHNAKTQAPSVCNALDTVLVHQSLAASLVPAMAARMTQAQVRVLLDETSYALAMEAPDVDANYLERATAEDFGKEFLSLAMSVRVVSTLGEAVTHIAEHGTNHSDGILTESYQNAQTFLNQVDSAAVYVNASTRFTDGSEFGLGAEVAISTQRMHARGPMGLQELTTYKWIIQGDYHVRQ